MVMAVYNDFFNIDNRIKGSIPQKKDSKVLKERILNSVKAVIDDDRNKESNGKGK